MFKHRFFAAAALVALCAPGTWAPAQDVRTEKTVSISSVAGPG